MEDDPKNSLKNAHMHSLKKDGFDRKFSTSTNELKFLGKTPFTISVEIPRGPKGFGFSVTWVQPVRVARVVADSPADHAGLKVGDRIIFISQENVVKASDKIILKLIKNERNTLQLEVYRRGLFNMSSLPVRQLEGITDSPASTSRFSNLSFTISEYGSSTPTLMRSDRGQCGRVPSNRIQGFNTPPISRHGGSWSRLSHDSHNSVDLGRRQAIYQLVTCEENFANLTYFGLERYVEPLRNKATILSSTEHIVLFQNIEELVWLSEGFVERIMEGDLTFVGNSIGGIFQEKILELCGAYQFYCNGVPAADTLLTTKMLNACFLQFLQDPPIPRERLDITSFIHRPVEHFREVLLLLQTILTHTETRHPDYDNLENVVETMKLYYKDITSTLDLLEPRVGTTGASGSSTLSAVTTGTTMEDLEQRLVFTKSAKPFKLCEPGRQWVFGSELQKQDGKIMKACWVMLFTDILVFTRVGRDKVLFIIEDPVSVTSISRAYFNIKKKNTEFRLIVDRPKDNQNALLAGLQKKHRAVVLRADSVELKTMWQSYIQRQVWLLRGHEPVMVVNPSTPGTTKRLWQSTDNNQKSNLQTPSKKITGTFVLGKKNKSKEPTFGRILPSSAGKRQFLLEFLEGRGRHIGKGFDTDPPEWDFDNDPLANLKGEDLVKLRQQMLSRKLPNYFEGEYEEFFFDDDEEEHKSSRGSDRTHSPAPTIRSNLSTPQRKHKVSPAMNPKKLSFKCPNDDGLKNQDRIINLSGDTKTSSQDRIINLSAGDRFIDLSGDSKLSNQDRFIDLSGGKSSSQDRIIDLSGGKSSSQDMISDDTKSIKTEKSVDSSSDTKSSIQDSFQDRVNNLGVENKPFANFADTVRGSIEKLIRHGSPLMRPKDKGSPIVKDKWKYSADKAAKTTTEVNTNECLTVKDSVKPTGDIVQNGSPKMMGSPLRNHSPKGTPALKHRSPAKVKPSEIPDKKESVPKNEESKPASDVILDNLDTVKVNPELKDKATDVALLCSDTGSEIKPSVEPESITAVPQINDTIQEKEVTILHSEAKNEVPKLVTVVSHDSTANDKNSETTIIRSTTDETQEKLTAEVVTLPAASGTDTAATRLRVDSPSFLQRELFLKSSPRLKDKVHSVFEMFTSRGSRASSSSSEASVIERPLVDSALEKSKDQPTDTGIKIAEKSAAVVESYSASPRHLVDLVPKTPAVTRREVRPTDLNLSKPLKQPPIAEVPAAFAPKTFELRSSTVTFERATIVDSPALKPRGLRSIPDPGHQVNPSESPRLLRERVQVLKVGERQKVQMTYIESPLTKRKEMQPTMGTLMYSPALTKRSDHLIDILAAHREKSLGLTDSPLMGRKDVKQNQTVNKPEVAIRTVFLSEATKCKSVISTDLSQEDKSSTSDTATLTETEPDTKTSNLSEEPEKVVSTEKVEPLAESSCTERKANSETSSGYQSEKASTDSPAVMHKEPKASKPNPNRDENLGSRCDVSNDTKLSKTNSVKEKDKAEKTVLSPATHDPKPDAKNEKPNKESPVVKHKDAGSGKLSPKQNEKVAATSTESVSQLAKNGIEGSTELQIEKPPIKEKRALKQETKPVKPSPDRTKQQKSTSVAGSGGGTVAAASPKVEGKIKPQQSPSPATKAAVKGKDTPPAKKEVKKPEPAKKAATVPDPKQAKAPQKTTDPTKIKSSDKTVKKEMPKPDKGKETTTDVPKKNGSAGDKPAADKPTKDGKDKKEQSASNAKFKEIGRKVAAGKTSSDPKLKKDKDTDSKVESIKKTSSERVIGTKEKADNISRASKEDLLKATPDKSSGDKVKEGRAKSAEKCETSTPPPPKPTDVDVSEGGVEKEDKGGGDECKIVQESLQKAEVCNKQKSKGTKKNETAKKATEGRDSSKSPHPRDPSKSPHPDIRSRIRSRLEGKTEGRSREGSPRLKKMRNDNKEFYFDADIEIDYPELVGTPRMMRRESLGGAVRRCGSIAENRRCGSFEEIQSHSSHHHEVPKSRDIVARYMAQRKDSFNSHSERNLAGKKTPLPETDPSATLAGNATAVAVLEPELPQVDPVAATTACPPGSGHCGEEIDQRYLSYRRDSYNSHTHRESIHEAAACVVEVHRTGSGRSPAEKVEKKITRAIRRKDPLGPPGKTTNAGRGDGEYDVPHCVIHNHKKTWREVMVHVKQKEYEVTDSSHGGGGEITTMKETMEFVIPNGDELGRLGSSLDDMLKCEVWLMNQCGNVEVSSAKQSSMSDGNSSTVYQPKTPKEKSHETSSRKTPLQKCEPVSGSPSLPSGRLANGDTEGSGYNESVVVQKKDVPEEKGLSKFKKKAAELIKNKNQTMPSPKLNSKSSNSKVPNGVGLETVGKGSPMKASNSSDTRKELKKSEAVNSHHKGGIVSQTVVNGSCSPRSMDRAIDSSHNLKMGKTNDAGKITNSLPANHIDGHSTSKQCISKVHLDAASLVVMLPEQGESAAVRPRPDEVNYMASTSKSGPVIVQDLEQPCCSRMLPPNDFMFDEDALNNGLHENCEHGSDNDQCEDECKLNGSVPGLIPVGDSTPEGVRRKMMNIKMGVKSKAGSQTGSPNLVRLAANLKLATSVDLREFELEAERRQSTGSLARQEDEKKGRFNNLFRKSASPFKSKEGSEDKLPGKLLAVKENHDIELKQENNRLSWFPWLSPWRKSLQECASLPATPPTHTPTLLPRDPSAASSAAARHGSDGDLGSWYDDEDYELKQTA